MPAIRMMRSHSVWVCPVFECGAVARPLLNMDVIQCVNGHEFSGVDLAYVDSEADLHQLAKAVERVPRIADQFFLQYFGPKGV